MPRPLPPVFVVAPLGESRGAVGDLGLLGLRVGDDFGDAFAWALGVLLVCDLVSDVVVLELGRCLMAGNTTGLTVLMSFFWGKAEPTLSEAV